MIEINIREKALSSSQRKQMSHEIVILHDKTTELSSSSAMRIRAQQAHKEREIVRFHGLVHLKGAMRLLKLPMSVLYIIKFLSREKANEGSIHYPQEMLQHQSHLIKAWLWNRDASWQKPVTAISWLGSRLLLCRLHKPCRSKIQ